MKILKLLFVSSLFSLSGTAATYHFYPEKGKVAFLAKGKPALISITGEAVGLSGNINDHKGQISGEILFNLEKLKTGITLRDEHMKNKYLEIEKYPVATLRIDRLHFPQLEEKFSFDGILTLHGISQSVKGQGLLKDSGNSKFISAEIPIKLSQFNIDIPSFKGITVAEDVLIKVDSPVRQIEQ